jgi:hypothetical protein
VVKAFRRVSSAERERLIREAGLDIFAVPADDRRNRSSASSCA